MQCSMRLKSLSLISGAAELDTTDLTNSSGPLFLSSLHCSEGDESLLDDCSHDPLGLASCSDDFGLAVVKCLGEEYEILSRL